MDELQLLRITDVIKIVPMGKSTIWDWVRRGKFPEPIKLGPKTTVWKRQDVLDWIKNAG